MIAAVADTHAAIWYLSADPCLSTSAKQFMDASVENGDEVGIASITLVEMIYLIEKNRIAPLHFSELAQLLNDPASIFVEIPLNLSIARTLSRVSPAQIPDMPDRIIAATALHLGVPLISRDHRIILSNIQTIW